MSGQKAGRGGATRLVEIILEIGERGECFCGSPFPAHPGWMECAQEEQRRRRAEADDGE